MSQNSQNQELSPLLIDGKELARLVGKTPRWVELNRHKIIGSQRVGGSWRYNVEIVRRAIASGKNIVI
jgi:hypothetical protein